MALLEKIRVKLGVFITIVIALALLSFIIDPNTLQSVSSSMSSKYDVGEINGKSISYQDFQKDVDNFTTINELINGNAVHSEEQQTAIRNAAWQSLIDKYVVIKNAKAAGLAVGETEMLSLTTGDMISPIISNNPAFFDENGEFSKDALVQFIQNIDSDPSGNLRTYWDYIQNTIYTQEFYSKYSSLFSQSNITNRLMLERQIEENNNGTDAEFVMLPFGYTKDTTIVVSDKEIKDYYKSHKKFYKQQASRDIEYVVFEVEPSAEDIAATNEQFASVYDEFATTDNMKGFLLRNSDRPLSQYYYKEGELNTISSDVNTFVFGNKEGVSPVYTKDNTFYAVKILDTKELPDSVYVRHILLQGENEALADSLIGVLEGKKNTFANVAALYSADQNPNVAERGDIGWMTQSYMIPGFESVMSAKVNQLYTIDTQYGKHIVEVTERGEYLYKKKQVAIMERTALASKATYNDYYSKANVLATKAAGKYESFKAAVEEEGLYAHPVNKMLESTDRLGSIDHTKEVTRWAFEAKKGRVSDIITVNNNYFFVVALKDIHEEGYATVQEVAPSIRNIIYGRKAGEKKAAEVAEKIAGLSDMQAIAEALGTTVSTKENITFASLTSQGLDPKFIGAVSVAEQGKICGPVAGTIGVYVFKVTNREMGGAFTEDDARVRNDQMSQYNLRMMQAVMLDDAEVKDNRARFY